MKSFMVGVDVFKNSNLVKYIRKTINATQLTISLRYNDTKFDINI